MKLSQILRLSIQTSILIIVVSCGKENEVKFIENSSLREKLSGTWLREQSSDLLYNYFKIEFIENNVNWYDSIVVFNNISRENGSIQTMTGSCPVKYSFNDGVEYYNPTGVTGIYSFSKFNENDIIWVFKDNYVQNKYKDYIINNSIVIFKEDFSAPPYFLPVQSSTVVFGQNQNVVTFCEPRDINWCYEFTRR